MFRTSSGSKVKPLRLRDLPHFRTEIVRFFFGWDHKSKYISYRLLQVLHAQDVDQRSAIFEKALEMGELYKRRCNMTILRSAILKNNIVVKTPRQEQAGAEGGGGGGHGSIIMQSGSDV